MESSLTTILCALIAAAASIIVSVINGNKQHKKTIEELDKHNNLQSYQIQELTKQVEKHNKVIERVFNLEKHEELVDEKLKVANKRIKDLEEFHKPGAQKTADSEE